VRRRLRRILLGLAPAALALACTKPPPPTISMEGRVCTAEPALAGAHAVALDDKTVSVTLDDAAACWRAGDGQAVAYTVFHLPVSAEPYTLFIASEPKGEALFAARVILTDESGGSLREIGNDAFLQRGVVRQANIRARPAERYAIVASDAQQVGHDESRLVATATTTSASTGRGGFLVIGQGSEKTVRFTLAFSGTIKVTAQPLAAK
jgi:hypothetical protein